MQIALVLSVILTASPESNIGPEVPAAAIRKSVTMYASFDKSIKVDRGGGEREVRTRHDHSTEKGKHVYESGYPENAFQIAPIGIHGGCLDAVDVLANRGRLFFPAAGKISYSAKGWSGTVSVWIRTNPDTLLKTPYCDPIQITDRKASDGAIWFDFPNTKPRDLRMGMFSRLQTGQTPVKESDPAAPLVRIRKIGFQKDDWHHVAMTWAGFDSGRNNASATLFIDGKTVGAIDRRRIAMQWDVEQTGIYFAVNLIGQLDELAIFDRALTADEIGVLVAKPGVLAGSN